MKFNHIPIQTPIMETAHKDNLHFYISPDGKKYPSITSILHSFPNPGIEIWKSKTPNWKEIQQESFDVGTELHNMIECYLKNDYVPLNNEKSINLFHNIYPELNKIDNIRCQERYLYEPNLRVAGTVDCIAEYDGVLSVIDFKNSRKPKKDWMIKKSGYLEQVTFYALAFKFCTGIEVKQGVILSANWDGSVGIKKFNIEDYIENLENIIEQYYENNLS